ncbi:CRAL-TRIO domain-containing protein F28H7.8 [Ditylenchus destructor]|nr:CRAL-TRIO domain-containing protein F28H7.8 [Ditylenchus destructor]
MTTVPKILNADLAQIQKLRELVKDELTPYYDTDFNLLRWLKGHNYNFEEIVPKLKNHLVLRKSLLQLDSLADKPRNHPVHEFWKAGLTTTAGKTDNVLVNVEQTGANDYWGMLHTFPLNEIMKARIYDLESMLRAVMDAERKTDFCDVHHGPNRTKV